MNNLSYIKSLRFTALFLIAATSLFAAGAFAADAAKPAASAASAVEKKVEKKAEKKAEEAKPAASAAKK